ncbi:MAG: cytochrome c [Acidimicrobiales bacterium]
MLDDDRVDPIDLDDRARCGYGHGRPATVAPRRAGEADGAYVFRTQCAGCHGTGGEGNVGPPLVGVADRLAAADEVAIVRNGRGRMPAFSPALSDDEIAAVVEHTRTQLR